MAALPLRPMPALYLLADHLDAVLAAGEDLLALDRKLRAADQDGGMLGALPDIVDKARALEIMLTTRTLQARLRAAEFGETDAAISATLSLFAASTGQLADAVAELADTTATDFAAGEDPLAYLRSRGVIADDVGCLPAADQFAIDEDFLIARRVPLGPLMDVVARALDLLDAAYTLYDDGEVTPSLRAGGAADQPSSRPQKLGQP